MIDYQHTGNRWIYRSINQLPGAITVKVSDGSRQPLLPLEPNQAKGTLGIFVSMDGNTKDQINHLLSKTRHMAEHLRTSRVEKREAWYTFTAALLKTIEYPMKATRLTKPQWEKMMVPLLSISLQNSGISQKFPRVIVHTAKQYNGLGILHPWYKQQLKHLQTLIGEISNNTPTGILLQASAEQLHLEIGLPGTFKDVPWNRFKKTLTSTWLTDLLFFLGDNDILLHDSLSQLQTQRQGGIFLMQCFLLSNPTDKELRCLMDCREYLQVTTLADITSVDGKDTMLQV